MVRALACAALAIGAEAVRVGRKHGTKVKHIAGVPILNYDQAYGGNHALLEEGTDMEENWIVMTSDVSDKAISSLCATSNCKDVGHPSEGGVAFFEVRCSEAELEMVIQRGDGIVEYIEPDLPVYALDVEAGLESAESQFETWGLKKIGADRSLQRQGEGANIYVLDTGIRTSHREFSGRGSSALDYSSGTRKECKGSTTCAVDRQGHGTHCAATTSGVNYGVAPRANVYAVKVLGDNGSGSSSWGIGSLDWVAANGNRPAIASMSLGGKGQSSSYDAAVTRAVRSGVTVVVAAGNSNDDACGYRPAHSAAAITVGSTDSRDRRSSFSNFGRCVNIWAPGSSVKSASSRSDTGTRTLSGTSMACPHVAGAAAIILSFYPSASPSSVRSKLLSDARQDTLSDLKSGDTNRMLYVGR